MAHCDIGSVKYLPEPESWLMLVSGIGLLCVFYLHRREFSHSRQSTSGRSAK